MPSGWIELERAYEYKGSGVSKVIFLSRKAGHSGVCANSWGEQSREQRRGSSLCACSVNNSPQKHHVKCRVRHRSCLFPKYLQPGQGQAKTKCQEFHPGPHGWQEPKHLNYYLFARILYQEAELEVERLELLLLHAMWLSQAMSYPVIPEHPPCSPFLSRMLVSSSRLEWSKWGS